LSIVNIFKTEISTGNRNFNTTGNYRTACLGWVAARNLIYKLLKTSNFA